ncbi:hypothetical protein NC661_19390 [Aquibacillus koreensis]|uniref:Uncharacterized protein n=1 Tax=Aquibacillus koreensis TaxID=279446 RepID=A0A9X3WP60_9BACI|nr:hypothetical protein [Aquibacillus koreensis]MCT2535355.1 hypothetical protein [Aquibacillus koreensis]MDC3422520.1 hypothetical protein [Aquibacillus koreensis]
MSEYDLYAKERKAIDALLRAGYQIKGMQDNLDGAMIYFEKKGKELEQLQVIKADTRKYVSNIIFSGRPGA